MHTNVLLNLHHCLHPMNAKNLVRIRKRDMKRTDAAYEKMSIHSDTVGYSKFPKHFFALMHE